MFILSFQFICSCRFIFKLLPSILHIVLNLTAWYSFSATKTVNPLSIICFRFAAVTARGRNVQHIPKSVGGNTVIDYITNIMLGILFWLKPKNKNKTSIGVCMGVCEVGVLLRFNTKMLNVAKKE